MILRLLEATHEIVGTEIDGIAVKANFTDFMDWIRREALDEVYVDVPMDSGESFIPYLEEMESMGLTVHFCLPLLDRIEEACCDETRLNIPAGYAYAVFVQKSRKPMAALQILLLCGYGGGGNDL